MQAKKLTFSLLMLLTVLTSAAQNDRRVQNKPYTDLRPMHFGILIGLNMQDLELSNVGQQTVTADDGTQSQQLILCDADRWNMGFSVGVLGELRLHENFSLRVAPTMHFGAKHITFINYSQRDANGRLMRQTQDLKNTYIAIPVDVKFAAPRFNNYRPYMIAGLTPTINLTGNDQDILRLKRFNTMAEIGIGCDFSLPFFKLIPELKFCFGLGDVLDHNHTKNLRDENLRAYSNAVSSAHSKMVVLTFYFE